MPDNQSAEKYKLLEMLGAEVHKVPTVPYANPNQYQKVAASARRSVCRMRSGRTSSTTPRTATRIFKPPGPEIWEQTDGTLDAFVTSAAAPVARSPASPSF